MTNHQVLPIRNPRLESGRYVVVMVRHYMVTWGSGGGQNGTTHTRWDPKVGRKNLDELSDIVWHRGAADWAHQVIVGRRGTDVVGGTMVEDCL